MEKPILCANQRWYDLVIRPLKTLDHANKGAVITLSDVDGDRRASEVQEGSSAP